MEHEPKVWLLQESWSPKVDLSSANRYGAVHPILSTADQPSVAPGPSLFKLKQALRGGYHPNDYIVYALSDPATAFLAGMVFAREGLMKEPINWLRWERERDTSGQKMSGGFYVPTQIEYR